MGVKFFVSDFHFGTIGRSDFSALSHFENFCGKNLSSGDELYILGDLFDFWIEYKNFVPAKFTEVYSILLNAKKRGVKIFIARGNHDFFRGEFFEKQGISAFDGAMKFEQNGKKFLCIHGDGISGNPFRSVVMSVLRNGFFQFLYKLLPPDFAVWFAETLSDLSRKKPTDKKSQKEKYLKHAFNFAEKKNCDVLVMGHSHIPDLAAEKGKIYANCGVWFEKPTFIELKENRIFLKELRTNGEKDIILCEKEI